MISIRFGAPGLDSGSQNLGQDLRIYDFLIKTSVCLKKHKPCALRKGAIKQNWITWILDPRIWAKTSKSMVF